MGQAKRSSADNVVKVDPKLNRPPQADESVPEALVPDVVRTKLHPGEADTAPDTQQTAPPDRWQRIQRRAYEIAQQRGFTPGAELNDWMQAEREFDGENGGATPQASPQDQFTG